MRALLFCLLAACGGGSPATPDGAADGAAGELCNGIDDTHDGVIDEGCPCASFDASTPGNIYDPDIVSAGDRYFVVTHDDGTLQIAPVVDGTIGTPFSAGSVPSGPSGGVRAHDMAWNGTTLAVVLNTPTPSSELALFDVDGTELGRQTLPSTAWWARVAWADDRFVLSGQSKDGSTLALAEYSASGTLLAGPIELAGLYNITTMARPAMSPSTYAIAVATIGRAQVFTFDRASHAGAMHELSIGSTYSQVSAAYADGRFAVTLAYGLGGDPIQFLDGTGAPTVLHRLPYSSLISMILPDHGGFMGVALLADTSSNNQYIAARLDLDGVPIAKPILPLAVTDGLGASILDATSTAQRFALSQAGPGVIRVIQHCW